MPNFARHHAISSAFSRSNNAYRRPRPRQPRPKLRRNKMTSPPDALSAGIILASRGWESLRFLFCLLGLVQPVEPHVFCLCFFRRIFCALPVTTSLYSILETFLTSIFAWRIFFFPYAFESLSLNFSCTSMLVPSFHLR